MTSTLSFWARQYMIAVMVILAACRKAQTPKAAFTYSLYYEGGDDYKITFSNASTGARSFLWHFGDGSTSVDPQAVHHYIYGSIYRVTLEAIGDFTETSVSDSIFLGFTSACEARSIIDCARDMREWDPILNAMTSADSTQYFYIKHRKAGPAFISIRSAPPTGIVQVSLLSPFQPQGPALMSATGQPGKPINLWVDSIPAGEYYVQLKATQQLTQPAVYTAYYSGTFSVNPERNNRFDQATPLIPNMINYGEIWKTGDEDYFIFKLDKACVVDFDLELSTPDATKLPFIMELYDQDTASSLLVQKTAPADKKNTLSVGPLQAGEHFIKIYCTGTAENGIHFRLTLFLDRP